MTSTQTFPESMGRRRWKTAGPLVLAAILALPVLLYRVDEREVSGIVEERVAMTAREMWRSGEWVLPTMNGEPRLQKPPLAYWLPQLTAVVRGRFDDLTLRLPFAILAAGSLLLMCAAGCLLLGPAGGLLAAIVLLTTPLFAKSGHMATPDGALLFSTVGAWFFHALARKHAPREGANARRALWSRIGFFVFLGLGALAKGPVILAIAVVPILLEAIVTRSKDPLRALWSPVGISVFLLLALSWPVLVALRLSDDPTHMSPVHLWVLESVGKVLPTEGVEDGYQYSRHHEPWYYYLTRLIPAFGVWSLALPVVGHRAFRVARRGRLGTVEPGRDATAEGALRTALIWFASMFLFFSCVSEKKTPYMLPLVPLGAFIAAAVCMDLDSSRLRRGLRLAAGAGALVSLAGVMLLLVLLGYPSLLAPLSRLGDGQVGDVVDVLVTLRPGTALALGGLACAGFLLIRALASRRAPVLSFIALGGTMAVLMIPYTDLRLALRPPGRTFRDDAREVACLIAPDRQLYVYGAHVGVLPGGMAYYLDRPMVFLGRDDQARALERAPSSAAVLLPWKYRKDFARSGDVSELESLPLEGPLEPYSLVRVINPLARVKDRVLLLEKRA